MQPMTSTKPLPKPATGKGYAQLVPSRRLTDLPTYVFAWLDELKAEARAHGADLIDLGMGNPDQPTPKAIIDVITRAYADPRNHGYPPFDGTEEFRTSVSRFMQRRFGVAVNPANEVLALSGAKEGIAHATLGFADESTISLVPDIYYPVHARATGLVGGRTHLMPLRAERGFLPDFRAIPEDVLRQSRLLVLNYPHNPTGAVAPLELYEEAVALCRKYGILLISDLAYSELTDDGVTAPSALQIRGARDVTIEFHSFSKTFNMAGSRIGFAVGGPELIHALHGVRTNMGYGTPTPIQAGAAYALDHIEELEKPTVTRYNQRRDALLTGFRSLGWQFEKTRATMFVWLPIPDGFAAQEWTRYLIDKAGVVVTPGNAFGPGGEKFFRVSLIADEPVLAKAVDRLRGAGIRYDMKKP
ncbi:MAG TPA: aminotransferase class I/II-fold pyridoxal phosphate-dependent enzyme [Gemmatimonadaceae bacterium]|jgi:LL-diaminopimelate aminotransferase|nr:aminotransferase class I/II-fold pyridoxal phosphate-dependent enzyme [Gemmatimonadaceae bacterium]